MAISDFDDYRAKWVSATHSIVGESPPPTSEWHGPNAVVTALEPFLAAVNHLHFPDGGGHDLEDVAVGSEPGTVEFIVGKRSAYLGRPAKVTLEYIASEPAESFLIVELDPLEPSGVYEAAEDGDQRRGEELVELSSGHYVERGVWDAGYIGHDEDGREVPLPKEARLLHRMFGGRLMLVTKGSLWNGEPGTYDGRHDRMSNQEIRDLIERSVAAQRNVRS